MNSSSSNGRGTPDETAGNADDTTSWRSPSETQSLYPGTEHGETPWCCRHPLESEPTGDASDHGDEAPRTGG